ncbi:MAG TPA: N-formylglutamate amidohydrolase [Hyphomicrobiaceae bacterium]|nr:N-formylglutamate amidohydrolase [Hyphomicrobiaceae bacterium]
MSNIDIRPGVFLRRDPQTAPVPVLIDVSRSGREYPPDFRSPLPFTDLHDNVSMYVEDLYAAGPSLGATLLYACFPNTYIDTNRSAADIDETLIEGKWPGPIKQSDFTARGLGLLKRLSRYGQPLQERKLTVEEVRHRLATYHEPYHVELSRLLAEMRKAHGVAFQLSCHCMSAVGAPTHADPGKPRADFNLGNMHGKTCSQAFLSFLVETLEGLGHSVSLNFPYYGGELIARHADPDHGIESVFIEINKKLFIDTATFKKTANFDRLKSSVDTLLAKVIEYARARSRRTSVT